MLTTITNEWEYRSLWNNLIYPSDFDKFRQNYVLRRNSFALNRDKVGRITRQKFASVQRHSLSSCSGKEQRIYPRDTSGDKLPSCKLWKWNFQAECDRPPAESALSWKWFWSPSRSQKSARADGRNIFRYLLIFPCLPRIILLPLGFSFSLSFSFLFFSSFHSHAFSLSVVRTLRTRMRDNIEKDFSHVLSNRGVIARISNVKYAFEIKKGDYLNSLSNWWNWFGGK